VSEKHRHSWKGGTKCHGCGVTKGRLVRFNVIQRARAQGYAAGLADAAASVTLVPTPPDAPDVRNPCSCGHTDGQHYEGCLECDRQYREHGMADRD
jgi:hypothetical protein